MKDGTSYLLLTIFLIVAFAIFSIVMVTNDGESNKHSAHKQTNSAPRTLFGILNSLDLSTDLGIARFKGFEAASWQKKN